MMRKLALLSLIAAGGLLGACSEAEAPDSLDGTAYQPATPVLEKSNLDFTELARLPVQSGQRYQPFDTFAKVAVRGITGKDRFHDTDPKLLYLHWRFDAEKAINGRFIKLPSVAVAEEFGLEIPKPGTTHASLMQVSKWDDLFAVHIPMLRDKRKRRIKLNDLEAGLDAFVGRVRHFATVSGREIIDPTRPVQNGPLLPIVPPEASPVANEVWAFLDPEMSSFSGWPAEKISPVTDAMSSLESAYHANDGDGFTRSSRQLVEALARLGPERHTQWRGMEMIDREVRLSRLNPFSMLRFVYFFGFFLAILAIPFRSKWVLIAPLVINVAALAYHVWALIERTVISQRAMIGNLYESALFMSAAAILIALVFEVIWYWRASKKSDSAEEVHATSGWFVAAGALVAMLLLFWAQGNPSFWNPEISTLQPVLINNSLIHIHVPTIMASYAVLALTVILAHVYLFMWLFKGTSKDPVHQASMRRIANSMFWTIPVGVISLFAGIVLGGVWADASWGRFWGWDPKETASLVTWIVFVILIHGRWAGWLRDVGTATGSMFGGLALLWTYWGANFVQKGMHSYAAAGADIPTWPYWYGGVELALLVTTAIVWYDRNSRNARGHKSLPPDGITPGDE